MLRDKNLIPLSHQHQHALALCVRIDRASPIVASDVQVWQAEIAQHFQLEISVHFEAEETVLFPEAKKSPELTGLISELLQEHADLRRRFHSAQTQTMSGEDVTALAKLLASHIRKEERQLFERLQQLWSAEKLAEAGKDLDRILQKATQACGLPSETSRRSR